MAIENKLALLLKSSRIGDDEPDLGEKLLKSFLAVLLESPSLPQRIICMNSAIFLTTKGSSVVDLLKRFEAAGTEILSCKTCLDYYSRSDDLIVGQPTDMNVTVDTLLSCRTINL